MSFEADSLADTLHLMKNRNVEFIKTPERYTFIEKTNNLLKDGLVLNLVKSIEEDVNEYYHKNVSHSTPQISGNEISLENLRKKGEILFFTFYQTQVTDDEEKSIMNLIKLLSNMIVMPSNQHQSIMLTPSWQIPICSLLVIIQLTHVCALQQNTTLLSRDRDYSQIRSVSELDGGNCLGSNKAAQKYDMNNTDRNSTFKCDGARGFACLVYAVLRQPLVDVDAAPALDVEYFLFNACITRAYSYIRLVMLPVLEASYVQDRDTSIFYVQVLCELLTNLSRTFCNAHYRDVHNEQQQLELDGEKAGDSDFPFVFFPPSQSFYSANAPFYLKNQFNPNAVANQSPSESDKEEALLAVDSLEDVLMLFNAVLAVRPEFANEFWNENNQPSNSDSSFDMSFVKDSSSAAHPFVHKCLQASRHHPSLLLVTIQFTAHLASGPLASTASHVYQFVRDACHPLLNWTHFFSVIDKIAQHLGAHLTGTSALASSTSDGGRGVATYAETIHAQQQMHLHQHSRHHRPLQLIAKDLDGLLGILDLLSAVCSSGIVAQSVLEQYPLVSRLFSLLSCATLPVRLKGAALHTLSTLARLNRAYANLIWDNIDFHKLLPSSSAGGLVGGSTVSGGGGGVSPMSVSSGGSFNSTAPHTVHPHERGLRAELEETEARAGQYPVTDGFLTLLGALLLHSVPSVVVEDEESVSRPTASSSGEANSVGVVRYLEYIVQDVLLKAHERVYSPTDSPLAYGARFRLTAKSLRVLTLVLQHYRVNLLPDDILTRMQQSNSGGLNNEDKAALTARGLWGSLQDFCEGTLFEVSAGGALSASNPLTTIGSGVFSFSSTITPLGGALRGASVRPKTAAFHLMVQLLNKSRLFNVLTSLLTECHAEALLHAYNTQCLFKISRCVSVVQQVYNHSLNSHTYNLANHSMVPVAPPNLTDIQNTCSINSNSNECESIFWREKAAAGAIGLLYEVSLRERKFNMLLRSTSKQLTLSHTEHGRTSVLPVCAADFSLHMCSSAALSLVTHFLAHEGMTVPCVPSMPVLCVRLLEHVALNIPNYQLLATLSQPLALSHLGPTSRTALLSDRMIDSVVEALHVHNTSANVAHTSSLCYDVVPRGGDVIPDTFSLSFEHTLVGPVNLLSSPLNAALVPSAQQQQDGYHSDYTTPVHVTTCAAADGEGRALQTVHKEYLRAANKHGSIRECVLKLLLSTLTPGSICLSHFLLGLTPSQQQWKDKSQPIACFEAVLALMSPENYPLGATLLQLYPNQAVDCYELLFRLVASPAVRSVVIARLNSPHVNYLQVHSTLLMYMTHLTDDELLYRAGDTSSSNKHHVEAIKSALHQSLAWLLKTASVVLYTVSSAVASNAAHTLGATSGALRKVISTLLSLYFNSCTKLAFSEERASEQSVVSKVLDHFTLFPAAPHISQDLSPVVRDCIAAASRRLELSKAGCGYGALNRFRQEDAGPFALLEQSLQYVDITLLQQYLQERRESLNQLAALRHRVPGNGASSTSLSTEQCNGGVQAAVMSNVYSQRIGAMVHCCMAWTQLLHVGTVLPQAHLVRSALPVAILDGLFDLSHVFAQVLVPLMNVMLSRPLVDVLVSETLAKALLALVTYVFAESNSVNNEAALGTDEFRFLVEGLLQLLLVGRISDGSSVDGSVPLANRSSSILFRSLVGTALTMTLHALTAAATLLASSDHRYITPRFADESQLSSEEAKTPSSFGTLLTPSIRSRSKVSVLDVARLEEYQHLTVFALETHITSLTDCLSADVLHAVSVLTKCSLLSALSAVLSLLTPAAFSIGDNDNYGGNERRSHELYGSHAFLQAVQLLVNRRYLSGLLGAITGESSQSSPPNKVVFNEAVFVNTLTVCTHLATTCEGVEGLLACGIMERLASLTDFIEPPILRGELLSADPAAQRDREENVLALQTRLIAVLRLLSTMLSTFSTHKAVYSGVTLFLRLNHKTVSHLLRLRSLTLTGLNMAELVAGLLSVLVSRPVLSEQSPIQLSGSLLAVGQQQQNQQHQSETSTASSTSTNNLLGGGDIADLLVGDMCGLLNALGSNLLPPHFTVDIHRVRYTAADSQRGSTRTSTWWAQIQPEPSKPSELMAANTLYAASELAATRSIHHQDPSVPLDWSLFDHFKLTLSLSLTAHLATFVRNLSTNAVSRGRSDKQVTIGGVPQGGDTEMLLLHLDLDVLCGIFVKTSTQILAFQGRSSKGADSSSVTKDDSLAVVTSSNPFARPLQSESAYWLASAVPVVASDHNSLQVFGKKSAAAREQQDNQEASESLLLDCDCYVAQSLLPRLVFIAESLLCAIHDLLVISGNDKHATGRLHAASITVVLNAAKDFPSHSFVRQTARWIRECVENQ